MSRDPGDSILDLSEALEGGYLVLFLGSGVSACYGLPAWWQLVQGMAVTLAHTAEGDDKVNLEQISDRVCHSTAADELLEYAERVKEICSRSQLDFNDLVRTTLYPDPFFLRYNILHQGPLVAIGSLCMRSHRGSVRSVVTYNYDSVLEWYTRVHGFETLSVVEYPTLIGEHDLVIYHPHGYLPHPDMQSEDSDRIILTKFDYESEMGEARIDSWVSLVQSLLSSKIGLFVGLSGRDPLVNRALVSISKSQRRRTGVPGEGAGYWLLGPKAELPDDHFESRGVVPIRLKSFDEYPLFLLSICQAAAGTPIERTILFVERSLSEEVSDNEHR